MFGRSSTTMSSSARFFPPLIKFPLCFKEKGGFLNRFESRPSIRGKHAKTRLVGQLKGAC